MSQNETTERCPWCKTDAIQAAARHEGPHATWCPRFREDQRGGKQTTLEAELRRRLWLLFDAAKAICERDTPEPAAWAALYAAVAAIPESQHP